MLNIWTIKGVLKYLRNCTWQANRCSFCWRHQRPIITDCYGNIKIRQWLNITQHNTNTTSLTNHWQKAGPIHSLAWTPQSIHTAFFWWRLLFPIWQETSRIFECCCSLRVTSFTCVCLVLSLLPEARKAAFPRTTSRWRTCRPGGTEFCSSQTSSSGSWEGKMMEKRKCYSRTCLQTFSRVNRETDNDWFNVIFVLFC